MHFKVAVRTQMRESQMLYESCQCNMVVRWTGQLPLGLPYAISLQYQKQTSHYHCLSSFSATMVTTLWLKQLTCFCSVALGLYVSTQWCYITLCIIRWTAQLQFTHRITLTIDLSTYWSRNLWWNHLLRYIMVSQYPIHTVLQLYSRGETHALSSGPSWGQYVNGAQSVNSMRCLNQCTLQVSMYVCMDAPCVCGHE